MVEAIASRLEAIASRLETIFAKKEVIAAAPLKFLKVLSSLVSVSVPVPVSLCLSLSLLPAWRLHASIYLGQLFSLSLGCCQDTCPRNLS